MMQVIACEPWLTQGGMEMRIAANGHLAPSGFGVLMPQRLIFLISVVCGTRAHGCHTTSWISADTRNWGLSAGMGVNHCLISAVTCCAQAGQGIARLPQQTARRALVQVPHWRSDSKGAPETVHVTKAPQAIIIQHADANATVATVATPIASSAPSESATTTPTATTTATLPAAEAPAHNSGTGKKKMSITVLGPDNVSVKPRTAANKTRAAEAPEDTSDLIAKHAQKLFTELDAADSALAGEVPVRPAREPRASRPAPGQWKDKPRRTARTDDDDDNVVDGVAAVTSARTATAWQGGQERRTRDDGAPRWGQRSNAPYQPRQRRDDGEADGSKGEHVAREWTARPYSPKPSFRGSDNNEVGSFGTKSYGGTGTSSSGSSWQQRGADDARPRTFRDQRAPSGGDDADTATPRPRRSYQDTAASEYKPRFNADAAAVQEQRERPLYGSWRGDDSRAPRERSASPPAQWERPRREGGYGRDGGSSKAPWQSRGRDAKYAGKPGGYKSDS